MKAKNKLLYLLDIKSKVNREPIDKSKGSLYNSWRSKVYTKKGKQIGFPDKWKTFKGFCEDMQPTWIRGKVLCRTDLKKAYSKSNCVWVDRGAESNGKLSILKYNGQAKTLLEWCVEYDLNYNGVRQRYHKGKNYTAEEVLFGKHAVSIKKVVDIKQHKDELDKKNKMSKMLSAYRCKDRKRGYVTNINLKFLRNIAENSKCIYCGDTLNIGLDRIDNNRGHEKGNVVPCCYHCNIARGDNFTFEEMLKIGKTIKEIKKNRHEIKTGEDI